MAGRGLAQGYPASVVVSIDRGMLIHSPQLSPHHLLRTVPALAPLPPTLPQGPLPSGLPARASHCSVLTVPWERALSAASQYSCCRVGAADGTAELSVGLFLIRRGHCTSAQCSPVGVVGLERGEQNLPALRATHAAWVQIPARPPFAVCPQIRSLPSESLHFPTCQTDQ